MAEIEFIFNGIKTIIQTTLDEKMGNIIQRFIDKANLDKNKIFLSYSGKIDIDEELTFSKIANTIDIERKKMCILVHENHINPNPNPKDIVKSKIIICPKCKENIKMDIKDYKIRLYECKNGHDIENILLDEFEETQNIDRKQIICEICHENNKSISYENTFFRCNSCNKDICPLCKSNHDKVHKIINYDDKFYICDKHNENYISYCKDCKINLCLLCDGHKYHERIQLSDFLPKKVELIEKLLYIKATINLFNREINDIINILKEVKNKMKIYYKINEDIINNYDIKNRNYEILYYLNQFTRNNIILELNRTINSNTIIEKFNNIFNIYSKMNIDEITIVYDTKGEKEINLFGEDFVERYKNHCKLIKDGKEKELKDKFNFGWFSTKKDILEFKLKGIKNITDISYMFEYCNSLIS